MIYKKKKCGGCGHEIEGNGEKDTRGYYHDEDCWYVANVLSKEDGRRVLKSIGRGRTQKHNKKRYKTSKSKKRNN